MARTVRETSLDTRAARARLKPQGKPYYRQLEPQLLAIGYRKPKHGAGRWVVRQYVGGGAYVVETIGTADDYSDSDGTAILSFKHAQDRARAMMVKRVHAAAGKHGPLTVADAIASYLQFLETNRKSATDARYRANALILPKLGYIEVASITAEVIRAWHVALARAAPRVRTRRGKAQQHREIDDSEEAKRRRRSSANRTLTILKAALNRAWREHPKQVPSNAEWARVEPFENVDAARVRYLTLEEATRLTNASDPVFRNLVQAGLQTGCRYGELARLTCSDFNRDSGTISIRQSKSGKARHVVLTADEGVAFFSQLCVGRPGSEIMLQKNGGQPWRASHQARPMAAACARAKIKPAISFHVLRHTWASLSVMSGVPLLVVAKNLGHSDTRMVERHYGHLAPSYVADAIRAGAPRFGTVKPSNVRQIG
jgi:integrase